MSRTMRIVVVLPAPLGPRKPSSSPRRTSNERSRTTSVLPNRLQTRDDDRARPRGGAGGTVVGAATGTAGPDGPDAWVRGSSVTGYTTSTADAGAPVAGGRRGLSVGRCPAMRIVSLLPSATEIVFALGLGDELVGRTPNCDYPAEVADVPVMTWIDPPIGARPSGRPSSCASRAGRRRRRVLAPSPGPRMRSRPRHRTSSSPSGCARSAPSPRTMSDVPRSAWASTRPS